MDKVVGRIPVLECLRAGRRTIYALHVLRDAKGLDGILRAAEQVPIAEHSRNELDALSGGVVHQGVVLDTGPLPVIDADVWLEDPVPEDAVVVILDGIVDPHNFGAIVRSASACGALAVIFSEDRSAPLSAATAKSAAGALEHIPIVRAGNLVRIIQKMKQAGYWVAALDAQGPQLLWEADLRGRTALVIGSEGKGLRRLVKQQCDLQLRIPLRGPITSLNASVSAAIALTECLRQRARAD
jgi:23S rRNA (guanosine2251-2'-O)-methyltransferase